LRRYLWLFLRLLFVAAVFAFILSRLDLPAFAEQVRSLNPLYIVPGVVLSIAALALASLRLKIIVNVVAPGLSLFSLFALNLVGLFYGQFLPGVVTGDVVKAYYLARTQADKVSIYSAVLVDRLVGISMNGLLGVVTLIGNTLVLETLGMDANVPVIFLVLAAVGLVGGYTLFPALGRWERRMPSLVASFYRSIRMYREHPGTLVKAIVVNFAFFLIWSVGFWCLALAVGLNQLAFPTVLLILAVVSFAQFIPLSINGWGVREGALIVLLSAYGVLGEQALLLSLLVAVVNLAVAALGGLVVLVDYRTVQNSSIQEKTWT
jgi:uncharacterized membrane protein YbhN (UPF0104 family)